MGQARRKKKSVAKRPLRDDEEEADDDVGDEGVNEADYAAYARFLLAAAGNTSVEQEPDARRARTARTSKEGRRSRTHTVAVDLRDLDASGLRAAGAPHGRPVAPPGATLRASRETNDSRDSYDSIDEEEAMLVRSPKGRKRWW